MISRHGRIRSRTQLSSSAQVAPAEAGTSLVEFALLAPFLLALLVVFSNVMVPIIRETWQWSVAAQISNKINKTTISPLRIAVTTGVTTNLSLTRLNSAAQITALSPSPGFLTQINQMMLQALEEAGTGAHLLEHSVASRLLYLDICPTGGGTNCTAHEASIFAGHATAASPAETAPGNPVLFHVGPGNDDCFEDGTSGSTALAQAEFDAFVRQGTDLMTERWRLRSVRNQTPRNTTLPPIGTLLLEPINGQPAEYLALKPVIAVMLCSKGGQVLFRNATRILFFLFPGKEASL